MTSDWSGFMLYAEKVLRDVNKTLTDRPSAKPFDQTEAQAVSEKLLAAQIALQNVNAWVEARIERSGS